MRLLSAAATLVLLAGTVSAAEVTGKYIEARTCDVWTGPCFANAEMNFEGKNAVLGWKIDSGTVDDVKLDGLSVVAIVAANDTFGMTESSKARTILLVDSRANAAQKEALVRLAKKQGGKLTANVVKVESTKIKLDICPCENDGCATLDAGVAKIETRCLNAQQHKVCGNESAFFPPLVKNVKVKPALAAEHTFQGKGLGTTWSDAGRRGAYLGSFSVR